MRDYRFITISTNKKLRNKSNRYTLEQAIRKLLDTLVQMRCTDCLKNGEFKVTKNIWVAEPYDTKKRFVVTSQFPLCVYMITKETTGDINQQEFIATMAKVKNKYFKGEF